ncbi:MAG: DUF6036 family nucleotidyltransferase [Roseibacillus sp.]
MREPLNKIRLLELMSALGQKLNSPGRIYVTGGATALLHGWREMTIDLDLKAEPEPPRFYEVIAELKNSLQANLELASPDQFLPPLPGWESRSLYHDQFGKTDFYHYDPYGQVLSKIERNHTRDQHDVQCFLRDGLVELGRLKELFLEVKSDCIRYPAIDAEDLENRLNDLIANSRSQS